MIVAAVLSAAALLRGGDFSAAAQAYQTQWQADRDADAAFALTQLALYDDRISDAQHWLQIARAGAPNDPRVTSDESIIKMRSDASIDRADTDGAPSIVPFVQTDPLPMVAVTIDGRDTYFLIDTGAPNIVLDATFAQQLGLPTTFSHEGTFAGGRHAAVSQTTVHEMRLGSWTISNVPASVLPVGNMMGGGHPIGGILGTALFAHFLTTLDYRNGRLILRDPNDSAQFESQAQASGATIVPMWFVGDHFVFVRARAGNGPEGLFNVDTGGTFGVQLTQEAIDAAGITLDSADARTGMGGGGVVSFMPFTTSVTLGALTKSNVNGVYTPQGSQYAVFPFDVTGTISHEFFRTTTLTFDFRAMRMVVL